MSRSLEMASALPAAFFWRGALLGLSIAAPVGPTGVLCIQRSVRDGMRFGLAVGLGAATADAAYGAVAAFGLTGVSRILVAGRFWLQGLGGLFLLHLGVKAWKDARASQLDQGVPVEKRPARGSSMAECAGIPRTLPGPEGGGGPSRAVVAGHRWFASYWSAVGLTLANPATILSFIAVFAGFGLGAAPGGAAATTLVAGVFAGSASWWVILSGSAGWWRSHLKEERWDRRIGQASGAVLIAFGLVAWWSMLYPRL